MTAPATITPQRRVLRTLGQAIVAVCVAIPTAVSTLGLSAQVASKVVGIAAALVVLVSAAQNALDQATEGRKD